MILAHVEAEKSISIAAEDNLNQCIKGCDKMLEYEELQKELNALKEDITKLGDSL